MVNFLGSLSRVPSSEAFSGLWSQEPSSLMLSPDGSIAISTHRLPGFCMPFACVCRSVHDQMCPAEQSIKKCAPQIKAFQILGVGYPCKSLVKFPDFSVTWFL